MEKMPVASQLATVEFCTKAQVHASVLKHLRDHRWIHLFVVDPKVPNGPWSAGWTADNPLGFLLLLHLKSVLPVAVFGEVPEGPIGPFCA